MRFKQVHRFNKREELQREDYSAQLLQLKMVMLIKFIRKLKKKLQKKTFLMRLEKRILRNKK